MSDSCMNLNDELKFFQDLILDILTRRAVFKKFEDELKKTHLTQYNDFVSLSWYGYVISQLSDCRKFFAKHDDAHSFQFVVGHIKDVFLKERHKTLFETWTDKKLKTVLNKYMLHADKRVSEKTEVSAQTLDAFIDDFEKYLKEIVQDLTKNYANIGSLNYDTYLKDRESEVDVFFEEVRKVA